MPIERLEDLILEYDQGLEAIKPKKKKKNKKKSVPETPSKEEIAIEVLERLSNKMSAIAAALMLLGVTFIIVVAPALLAKAILDIFLPAWLAWFLGGACGFCIFSSLLEEIVEKMKE